MKKILLIILLCNTAYSQSVCNPIGTTTNPNFPTNPQNQSFLNNFDWTTTSSSLNINTVCTPNSYTTNPFESNQTELLPLSLVKDNKPEDGWEIVAYNLGYNNNNTPLNVRPEHTYYMLYNKYTGIVRVLVKWCRNVNYNGAMLTIKFAPGFQSNLLDMAYDEKTTDMPHIANPSFSTVLKFYNDNNFWGYADFKLNYDPCTCSFTESSRLLLYSELITNSSVELTGKISGTISSITNGAGSVNSNGSFWKTANVISDKMMQIHGGITSFQEKYQKIYENLADGGITINAINQLGNFFNNNAFMKAGLKAVPYASSAVKFLSGLLGGGASGNQPIQLSPLSVNLDVKISGTISTQDPMHNVTIGLPGSQSQNILQGVENGQPLYNETLGVFSLVNQPIMYYTETPTSKGFVNRERKQMFDNVNYEYWELYNEYNFISRNYKLSGETLKYAINPASNLILQDAEIMLITEYEHPSFVYKNKYGSLYNVSNTDEANGLPITGTNTGPMIDNINFIFQNSFNPIGANNFKNDYSFSYLYDIQNKSGSNYNKKRRIIYSQGTSNYYPYNTIYYWKGYNDNTPCIAPPNWPSSEFYGSQPFRYVQTKSDDFNYSTLNPTTNFRNVSIIGMSGTGQTIRPEFLAPKVKQFKLKFVLNLKRTDNPNAQNVLYVVTYPVKLLPAPVGYNMTGSDYILDAQTYANQIGYNPATPTNKFVPATQAELATLCSSTTYRNGRTNLQGRISNQNLTDEDKKISNSPVLYPVPIENTLNIKTNSCNLVSIIDINGSIIMDISNTKLNDDIAIIDVSNLKKGIYMISYYDSKGEIHFMKMIK
ncbi:T9SS type A sorting domain-containing protein [Flavobacterium urocaniciphilum]|uniref:Secretion system C-terminal sorting domain-containing protein n=1 Tax=Flavobacterium urocaniciphilum TaxID=1299341 RepID=A0A1H9EAE7_9FLAO|nr:T9SS type A sorting domain-containing protein [Flavobacterium urocaniciphilum]SEQ21918.1 hypothetical protein SAMN05444005_11055 [Flavobacterium urocaniciphilum]